MHTVAHTCGIRLNRRAACPACAQQLASFRQQLTTLQAAYLALMDERDQLRDTLRDQVTAAAHRGWQQGLEAGHGRGYADACADVKRTEHAIVRTLRSGLPTRYAHTKRRDGDFPGGEEGLAKVRESWAAYEATLDEAAS